MNQRIAHWMKAYEENLKQGCAVALPTGTTLHFNEDCYYANLPEGCVTLLGTQDHSFTCTVSGNKATEDYALALIPKGLLQAQSVELDEATSQKLQEDIKNAVTPDEPAPEDHHD